MADKKFRFPFPSADDPTAVVLVNLTDNGDGTFSPNLQITGATLTASNVAVTGANINVALISSAERTATATSATQTNTNARGLHVVIDITASSTTTASLVPKIQGQDAESSKWYDLLIGTALTTTGTTTLKVYPGIGVVSGGAASDILPKTWRVTVVAGTADPVTYSVGAAVVA